MKKIAKSYPVATFFVLTFLITGGAALLTRLMTEGVIPRTRIVPAIAPFGPSLAGVILMAYLYGASGCRYLITRLNPRRMGWPWMILCVLLPPCLLLLVVAIHAAMGGESLEPRWFTLPNLITGTLWSAFLGAGLTEEFGWRGFALPHLQRSRSALTSALVIGLVWAVWHLLAPLFGVGSSVSWLEFLSYLVGITAMSIVYVAVFNATRGSLIAVMLLHGANNTSWRFLRDFLPEVDLGGSVVENFLVGALWVIVASICVVVFGPEHLSREHREIVNLDSGESAPNTEESHAPE